MTVGLFVHNYVKVKHNAFIKKLIEFDRQDKATIVRQVTTIQQNDDNDAK